MNKIINLWFLKLLKRHFNFVWNLKNIELLKLSLNLKFTELNQENKEEYFIKYI